MRKVGIGFMSGSIASVANIPIDVAKSRIQVQFLFYFVYSLLGESHKLEFGTNFIHKIIF